MQHTRIPVEAVSHLFNIFDLMAAILSHVCVSCGFVMLAKKQYKIQFEIIHWYGHYGRRNRQESTKGGNKGLHVHITKY